jgi:hypothetical protein
MPCLNGVPHEPDSGPDRGAITPTLTASAARVAVACSAKAAADAVSKLLLFIDVSVRLLSCRTITPEGFHKNKLFIFMS